MSQDISIILCWCCADVNVPIQFDVQLHPTLKIPSTPKSAEFGVVFASDQAIIAQVYNYKKKTNANQTQHIQTLTTTYDQTTGQNKHKSNNQHA
jgi:hypothetical protein